MDPTQPTQPTQPLGGTAPTGREPEHGRYAPGPAAAVPVGQGPQHDPGYAPGHGHPGHDSGPGFGDRAQGAAATVARHVKTPETKEFFKTSEFLVWGLVTAFILIAASVVGGENDNFVADEAWRYVTIVSAAYIISRGISKAGTRRGHGDAPMDRGY